MSAGEWIVSSSGVSGRSDMAARRPVTKPQASGLPLADRNALAAILAGAADLDHRALGRKAGARRRVAHAGRQFVVVDVRRLPASVADQENAVVQASGMRRWRHRRWRFRPAARGWTRRTGRGCDRRCWPRPACRLRLRDRFGDVIGAGRLGRTWQAHRTPRRACRSIARRAKPDALAPRRAARRPDGRGDRVGHVLK